MFDVPLAPRTTLRLGGAARELVRPTSEEELADALVTATDEGREILVLGGGSNLVVGDAGFGGLVVAMDGLTGLRVAFSDDGTSVLVDAAAGEPWDAFVRSMVADGHRGVECLAGIPGLVGATPIQNVGAYGSEVVDTIVSVRAFDRRTSSFVTLANADCGFRYRQSRFKGDSRFVVVSVRFRFDVATTSGPLRYRELANALSVAEGGTAPLARVVETVTSLRRAKGMVVDPSDPESVSAGSFFTNPVLGMDAWRAFEARARSAEFGAPAVDPSTPIPSFPEADGRVKLSAGWLVERSGFPRGTERGRVKVSSKHALALVHKGGGTTAELVDLARAIRDGVRARFGVVLVPEPVFVGVTF
ncbi:MAG: UDP-N-acetylmuramate dehydrogenase [Polyangiaceae bacterium]